MSGFYVTNESIDRDTLSRKLHYLKLRGHNTQTFQFDGIILSQCSYHANGLDENIYMVVADCTIPNMGNKTHNEYLIDLYKQYGYDMVKHINGAFAFVIYDKQKDIFFGARDRLGEKPFFYYFNHDNGKIELSSSLKAICAGKKNLTINSLAKHMYMKYGFIYDTTCIFKEVNKLQAGHYFVYQRDIRSLTVTKYWDVSPEFYDPQPKFKTIPEVIEHIDYLLKDAIKIRIPEDETIGMGISSGTDSFSIYGYLRSMNKDAELYNMIPNKLWPFNEYPKAQKHVSAIDPDKAINAFNLNKEDLNEGVLDYVSFYEEPNSDFSCAITSLMFSKMADAGISTAFSGIGADDIFFGKPSYEAYLNDAKKYHVTYSDLRKLDNNKVVIDDCSEYLDPENILSMQLYDIKTYLPNLLVKEDIASSIYGISVVNPFCDYRLVEFLNTLDKDVIYHDNKVKYLLKQMLLDKYGIDFFRIQKKGFSPDLRQFIRTESFKTDMPIILSEENLKEYFPEISYEEVKKRLDSNSVGYHDRSLANLYFYIKVMLKYRDEVLR